MKRKRYDWKLPREIEKRLGETTYGRQRAIFEADHLFIVLHAPPADDAPERECVLFLRTPEGKYLCNGKEGGEGRLRRLLSSYDGLFEKYDGLYDKAASSADLFNVINAIAPINRATTNLHNALQSARSFVEGDSFLIAMRDEAYEVSRNFELLLGDAKLALDYRIARNAEAQAAKAEEMTSAQHKLNVLAAVTFPLMAIATLMGMNLTHGLENRPPSLFWAVVIAAGVVGLAVMGWVIRKTVTASANASATDYRGDREHRRRD
jgi:hypothetical protein